MENVVRGHNWYIQAGNGPLLNFWRVLDEVELPELNFSTEDYQPGGHMMTAAFPETLDALKASIKVHTDDPRVRALCGRQPGDWITATHYENLQSFRDGTNKGRVITLKGLINAVKPDARKGVKKAGTQYEFSSVVLYHDIFEGKSVHRFDFFAGPGATLVDGVNPFEAMAANLAISGGVVL